jgi:hypothetical protein
MHEAYNSNCNTDEAGSFWVCTPGFCGAHCEFGDSFGDPNDGFCPFKKKFSSQRTFF